MSFVHRQLRATFSYGTGPDGKGPANVVELADLRMTARIVVAGGVSMGELQLQVYGMTLSMMNELSTLGTPITVQRRNTISVEAGDSDTGMAKIYSGAIYSAWADMNAAPNVAFNVSAHAGLYDQMAPSAPSSFPGAADAAQIMAGLARQMGYTFENNGVSGTMLSNPYFNGTARVQAQACAQAANIDWVIDNGVLAIWPKGGSRGGSSIKIGPDAGMVGYPTYTANGLIVRALFNPNFRFGALVETDSSLAPARGKWKIVTLTHDLAAEYPGGPWFTEMMLTPPGQLVVGR